MQASQKACTRKTFTEKLGDQDIATAIVKPFNTGSGKTSLIATTIDIHFLLASESCTRALPRNTKYIFGCRWPGLLSLITFADTVKP